MGWGIWRICIWERFPFLAFDSKLAVFLFSNMLSCEILLPSRYFCVDLKYHPAPARGERLVLTNSESTFYNLNPASELENNPPLHILYFSVFLLILATIIHLGPGSNSLSCLYSKRESGLLL